MSQDQPTDMIYPPQLRLEASSFCQLKCPSCPTGEGQTGQNHVGLGFLKAHQFEKLLAENSFLERIELSNWGEIFLNKEIAEIFRMAHEKSITVHASNGVNLNNASDEALEAAVLYKVEHLTCSIDGASDETYEVYRRRGNFSEVIRHIKKLNEYKKKHNSDWPKLTWQFVIFGHNEHELPKARKMAAELGMKFRPKLSWDEKFSPIKDAEFVKAETGLEAVSRSEFIQSTKKNYVRSICMQLWNEPQVNFDGKLLGCCVNTWGDFGNVFDEGLGQALNNKKMKAAREMLMGLREEDASLPCSRCSKYLDMKKYQNWITEEEIKEATGLEFRVPVSFVQKALKKIKHSLKL